MPTSIITNTVTDATGAVQASIPVIVRLFPKGAFRVSDSTEVAPVYVTVTNASGVWTAALERTSNISPANSYYVVEEQLPGSLGGSRSYAFQVGAVNTTLLASLVTPIPDLPAGTYLTQTAADARYVQSPGSFATSGNLSVSRPGDVANAGVLNTYPHGDHTHNRELRRGTAAAIAALAGVDLVTGDPYVTSDANNLTGTGIATPDTTSQPARTDSLFVRNAMRFQPGFWNQPWGVMGYVQYVNAQVLVAATETDVTNATLTIVCAANRRYKITAENTILKDGTQALCRHRLFVAGAAANGAGTLRLCTINQFHTFNSMFVISPAAGSTVFKLRMISDVGALTISNDTVPGHFLVEDIGPNGAPA